MYQSSYLGSTPPASGLFYYGGIYEFWIVPRRWIELWKTIDPQTQQLSAEPELKSGKTWLGPIPVRDRSLGYTETQQPSKAGPYYDWKIVGDHTGDDITNSAMLHNLALDEFIIIAHTRAGNYFKVFGHPEAGLKFDHESFSGEGSLQAAGSKFMFIGKSPCKAPGLAAFSGSPATAPAVGPGGSTTSSTATANDVEVITFSGVSSVSVNWTLARQNRFGQFPVFEVWINDGTDIFKAPALDIKVDAAPPSATVFTILPGGTASGFIIIK
jgi:hypothetical protein